MAKVIPPNFKNASTEQAIISVLMQWLHCQGCAVVVWTEKELRGVNPDDLESGMIEWSSEAILMNVQDEADANNKAFREGNLQ